LEVRFPWVCSARKKAPFPLAAFIWQLRGWTRRIDWLQADVSGLIYRGYRKRGPFTASARIAECETTNPDSRLNGNDFEQVVNIKLST
jgi:hypothetical protein